MGAWIEIGISNDAGLACFSRTPRWVRGLKSSIPQFQISDYGRTPRWVRGLKYVKRKVIYFIFMSHPTMGAWIEINKAVLQMIDKAVAPHDGCVD